LTVHALIKVVSDNAVVINGMGKGEEIAKVKMIIDAMLRNKEMMIMIIAFAITIAVVYMIRRMSIEHSWTIAMVAGAILNIVIILIGDLKYDTQVSVFGVFVTSLLALAIAKLLEFMFFCVDYSRTEKVQFEDDEYYYYVKAIPKMNVAVQSKTVKKINTQKSSGARRSAAPARTGQRSMMTERTDLPKRDIQRSANEKKISSGGRSVTIGNYIDEDDFEDLD